jgi:galactokinase
VNLLGEHTDYNGGPVLPVALDRRTAVAASRGDGWAVVSDIDGTVHALDPEEPPRGGWGDYVRGVIRVLAAERLAPRGGRLAIASRVPVGAGLSSSAALAVSVTRALLALAGRRVPPMTVADLAYRAEHDEVGVACGRMDQTVAALAKAGTALLFETGAGTVRYVPLRTRLWLLETGVTHRLTGGGLNQRQAECRTALRYCAEHGLARPNLASLSIDEIGQAERWLPVPFIQRARHVVTETIRTRACAAALLIEDLPRAGALMVEGHRSLQTDFRSSIPEADFMVDALVAAGALGARLTGAGFGGAVVALMAAGTESRVLATVQLAWERTWRRPLAVWATRAGSGMSVARTR